MWRNSGIHREDAGLKEEKESVFDVENTSLGFVALMGKCQQRAN